MCKCTPGKKTPFCGAPGCEWPPVKPQPAATPAQAEELAKTAIGDYLTACRMVDAENIGNYLMKLASVAGVMMANAEGADTAFDRLRATAQFVLETMPKQPATLRTVQ